VPSIRKTDVDGPQDDRSLLVGKAAVLLGHIVAPQEQVDDSQEFLLP
jgi:hypothetical protein